MDPKVSIILPVYNSEQYLSACLNSILNQTYNNFEVIIIDDGSTDNSKSIIRDFAMKDQRISYVLQSNSGPSEARNKGIIKSSGEFIVFIDSDDTVEKLYIESLITKMITTKADLVCCGYKDISIYGISNHTDFEFEDISVHNFLEMVCKGTGGVLWAKMFKKEIIDLNNLKMDKEIFMSEDLIFVLKYASCCHKFETLNEYLYNYNRLNQKSISSNFSSSYVHNHIKVCDYIEKIFKTVNFDLERVREIMIKRNQDLLITVIEHQARNVKSYGLKNAELNIRNFLSIPYIKKYNTFVKSKTVYNRLLIFFINKGYIKTCIIYGISLNYLKSIKNKLISRKQVNI